MRVGDILYLLIAFNRDFIYMAVDVVGIGEGMGAAGAGGWFWRRVLIRSIYCCCMIMKRCC